MYVLEANPRASRTVPFVAKATACRLVEAAVRVALGERVRDLDLARRHEVGMVSVKEAVLPFDRFSGADALLGPEMRSTGEVMGIGPDFATAFAKAERAAGQPLPRADSNRETRRGDHPGQRPRALRPRRCWPAALRPRLPASTPPQRHGPGHRPARHRRWRRSRRSRRPDAPDTIRPPHPHDRRVDLIINTPLGRGARGDGQEIRRAAIAAKACP